MCWCVGVWLLHDASMRGVSSQPKLTVLTHAYWVLVCWCVGVWLLCDVSMRVVSTQPKLTVLPMPTGYWRVGVR